MSRKQNSLMRFSRTERLAQLSEQEIVIEKKKREIQAKIEAQKKKETEEALRKLESSREPKNNKVGFSKKSWSRSENKEREESDEQEKKESHVNAFSNDGSFLDQFKKLSKTGVPNIVDVQMLAMAKKNENEVNSSRNQDESREQKRNEDYRDQDICMERNRDDTNLSSSVRKPLDLNVQLQLPPPGMVQLVPDHNVSIPPPTVQSVSMVPPPYGQVPPSQSLGSSQVSSYITNPPNVNLNIQVTPQPVPPVQNNAQADGMSYDQLPHLSHIQQHLPPPSLMKTQRPPLTTRESELFPKIRTESISMTLKNNTVKKLELIPNPLDTDDTPSPPSSKKPMLCGSERKEVFQFKGSQSLNSAEIKSEDSSRISSALYNDEDEKKDDDSSDVKYHQWAEMVARCGDEFENTLRNRNENDPNLRFLHDKNSKQYALYRKLVLKYRRELQKSSEEDTSENIGKRFQTSNSSQEDEVSYGENALSGNSSQRKFSRQRSSDSDGSAKESGLNTSARKKPETHSGNDGYQADNEEDGNYYKMPESGSKEDCFLPFQRQMPQKEEKGENSNEERRESSDQSRIDERRKRKRKSRWGDAVATSSTVGAPGEVHPSGNLPTPKTPLLSQLTRSDPGLMQYARQTFGSTNLSEEDWKKAEDHYKINLLYQDMVKKRAEIDKLERAGKFKYEYDSDEDVEGGTWEHKLRQQEMMATQLWAEELTRQAAGKHHIGDFLPPEELERFMEKYNAVKEGREPDLSDYKEFKLKQDNVGYRLLQKMGWNEGQGLGQDGSGITNPVNKATTRHENQGLGIERPDGLEAGDDEYDAYRKRMMLAYRFRPNPLNNPRRPYY